LQGCGSGSNSTQPPSNPPTQLVVTQVVTGLASPVDLQMPDDDSGRFFVVEQGGTIRIVSNGTIVSTPFLDISAKVTFSGEMGLLGLAFHHNFAQNGLFYVDYDRTVGSQVQTIIAEYSVSSTDGNRADPASERILLTIDQPFTNHKGGQLAFGPDGYLYIAMGDGGSGGDPFGNGQNLQTLLGKVLRIDVDRVSGALPYAIPPDNPFASGGGLAEIWAYGLRNPWRFSFDRASGRLFCGDVGENAYEEIDILQKGGNFGWNIMEGMHCYSPATGCNMKGLILPITEYDHSEGVTILGGYVYNGKAIPFLVGTYVFGDFSNGKIWSLVESPSGTWTRTLLLATGRSISSFGQDASGELYVVDYSGSVLKFTGE
jgi:glucose/arabinose dehydrogenase